MKTIKVSNWYEVPLKFTGIAESTINTKIWYKDGNLHREDGPAVQRADGGKEWWIKGKCHRIDGPAVIFPSGKKEWHLENMWYGILYLKFLVQDKIFLGKEKNKYGLYWLKFLTETEIEEFPIIPGMEQDEEFKPLFNQLFEAPIK